MAHAFSVLFFFFFLSYNLFALLHVHFVISLSLSLSHYLHYKLLILAITMYAGIRSILKALPGLSVINTFLLVILFPYW